MYDVLVEFFHCLQPQRDENRYFFLPFHKMEERVTQHVSNIIISLEICSDVHSQVVRQEL